MADDKIRTTIYWDRGTHADMKTAARINRRSLNAELMVAAADHIKREARKWQDEGPPIFFDAARAVQAAQEREETR